MNEPNDKKNFAGTKNPSLFSATITWAKIGFFSFGGPAAQIGLIHQITVIKKRWLTEKQFLDALSFCMLLPGPEAMQLATYIGWKLHRVLGGLIAGLLFVTPGALLILILSLSYAVAGTVGIFGSVLYGIKGAVVIIVLQALIKLTTRTFSTAKQLSIGIFGFISIYIFNVQFPIIILIAAIIGSLGASNSSKKKVFYALPKTSQTLKLLFQWLAIWWSPILVVDFIFGAQLLAAIGYFFSKLAIVTFGGAYAVLAYMAQDIVEKFSWLNPIEMMDGLGLAETTPGPLILVTEFVGFVTAFKSAGIWYGVGGATIALWATFVPCFLWIFVGAPYLDWLTGQPKLNAALSGIMAAVVGVITNLFVWFSIHVFFTETIRIKFASLDFLVPNISSFDPKIFFVAFICALMSIFLRLNLFWIIGVAALGGIFISKVF